jgi:hypothetical protein
MNGTLLGAATGRIGAFLSGESEGGFHKRSDCVDLVEDSLRFFAEGWIGCHAISIHTYVNFVKKKMVFAKKFFSSRPANPQITTKTDYFLREKYSFFRTGDGHMSCK